jgi:hypothetical protein
MGKWMYGFTILDLDEKWRSMNIFTPQPLYPRGNSPRYLLVRRLDVPQNWFGCFEEEKNVAPAGNRTPVVHPVALRYTD